MNRRIKLFGPCPSAPLLESEVNRWFEENDIIVESWDVWLSTENDNRFKDKSEFLTILISYQLKNETKE